MDFRLQPGLLGLQGREAFGVGLYLGLHRLGLLQLRRVLFRLTHQHPHLLAQAVPLGAELAGLRDGGAVLLVQLQELVHQGEFRLLKFLLDVLFYRIRVLPDEFNVQHGLLSPLFGTSECWASPKPTRGFAPCAVYDSLGLANLRLAVAWTPRPLKRPAKLLFCAARHVSRETFAYFPKLSSASSRSLRSSTP